MFDGLDTVRLQQRRSKTFLLLLILAGLAGVASLALVPLESLAPTEFDLPRIAYLVQPAVITIACAFLGWWAAPKVGLDAPVLGALVEAGDVWPPLRKALFPAFVGAAITAAIITIYGHLTAGFFEGVEAELVLPLATKLLFGGISEEIIARWGVLSLLMVLAIRLRAGFAASFRIANVLAALLFAIGHFGLLFSLVPDPPVWLMFAVIAGNMIPALVFGWLFRSRGLESAMLAHAGGHLFAVIAAALLL